VNTLLTIVLAIVLFAGMLACSEVGRRIARARAARDPDGAWSGVGVVDGAVFGLLGLLIAFTFSGAMSRFDGRRALIVEETNAIGTAWLRLDLLPAAAQPALRDDFRRYVDSRIKVYASFPDVAGARAELDNASRIQGEIWKLTLAAAQGSQPATMLLTPALNAMFDIATSRTLSMQVHPPPIVFAMLYVLALIGATIAGYGMGKSEARNWLHMTAFAVLTSLAFYVILDIEHPRLGFIRADALDLALFELRKSLN
jgi:hypothetical protein